MDYQETLLKNYHTHSNSLDPSDNEKFAWFKFYVNQMYRKHLENFSQNSAILELGCNKGFLLASLSSQGFNNLYGVDLSRQDLDVAQHVVPQAQLFYQDAFDYLDNNPNKFDLIILKALIEHIKKDKILLFLEKINNSLTPHGKVLIDVQNSAWIFGLHDRYVDFTHEVGFTKESLHQVMVLNFDNVQVNPTSSPLWKMNRKGKLKNFLAKRIVFPLLRWAEPETPFIQERLLIAVGSKKTNK